jgi:hypothetical protein
MDSHLSKGICSSSFAAGLFELQAICHWSIHRDYFPSFSSAQSSPLPTRPTTRQLHVGIAAIP